MSLSDFRRSDWGLAIDHESYILNSPMKSKITSGLLLLAVAILFVGCSEKSVNQQVKHIDLSESWKSPEKGLLSSIADDIEYIPLETTPNCLIGNHRALEVTPLKKYLLIHEHNKVMKLFDRQGNFLNTIGRIGKGPEEYIPLNKYFVDEKQEIIYLLSNNNKCLIYGFDGHLKREINLQNYADHIIVDTKGNIGLLYLAETALLKDSAKLQWLSPEGIEESAIPLYPGRQMGGGKHFSSNVQLFWHNEQIRFGEIPFDTLYTLNANSEFEPTWSFNPGEMKMPEEVLHSWTRIVTESNNYTTIYIMVESYNYFFMTGGYANFTYKILAHKNTGITQAIAIYPNDPHSLDQGFINDIDGGLPFWPKTVDKNLAITCLSPFEAIEKLKDQSREKLPPQNLELAEKYSAMVGGLGVDDNPIVMIVKLK